MNLKSIGLTLAGIGISFWLGGCGSGAPVEGDLRNNSYARRTYNNYLLEEFSGESFSKALQNVEKEYYLENNMWYDRLFPKSSTRIYFMATDSSNDRGMDEGSPFISETRIYKDNGFSQVCSSFVFPREFKVRVMCDLNGNKLYDTIQDVFPF